MCRLFPSGEKIPIENVALERSVRIFSMKIGEMSYDALTNRDWRFHVTRAERNRMIIEAMEAETERALVSRKAARDLLISEGIYTKKGKLRVEFGGESSKKKG